MDQQAMHLLVVLEESQLGLHAAATAAALARRLGAGLTLHVAIPVERIHARSAARVMSAQSEHEEKCRQRAAEWFARAHAVVQPHGVPTRTVLTLDEDPCAAVLRMADEHACDLIVVGSHGRGSLARAVSGSLVAKLVRLSRVPLLVCREGMHAAWLDAAAAG